MPSLSFADLQSAAQSTYEDFVLELPDDESVTFKALLRLPRAKREEASKLLSEAEDTSLNGFVDTIKAYFKIRLSAADNKKLVALVTDDDTLVVQLFELLSAADGLGEA